MIQKTKPLMKAADNSVVQMVALIQAGDHDGLAAYTAKEMYPAFDPMQGVITELIQVQLDVSKSVYEESVAGVRTQLLGMVIATLLAISLGGGQQPAAKVERNGRLGVDFPHPLKLGAFKSFKPQFSGRCRAQHAKVADRGWAVRAQPRRPKIPSFWP